MTSPRNKYRRTKRARCKPWPQEWVRRQRDWHGNILFAGTSHKHAYPAAVLLPTYADGWQEAVEAARELLAEARRREVADRRRTRVKIIRMVLAYGGSYRSLRKRIGCTEAGYNEVVRGLTEGVSRIRAMFF